MHKMAFAHVFGPEKKTDLVHFRTRYKFFVCIRVGLTRVSWNYFSELEPSELIRDGLRWQNDIFPMSTYGNSKCN